MQPLWWRKGRKRSGSDLLKKAESVLRALIGKSGFVDWNNGKRKEYFGIVARKIEGKDQLKKMGFLSLILMIFRFDVIVSLIFALVSPGMPSINEASVFKPALLNANRYVCHYYGNC